MALLRGIRLSQFITFGAQTHPKEKQAFFFYSFPSRPVLVAAVRVSPCHSRQPSIISDASALEGDRSSTPSDINSPRHRTHSLCNVRPAHHCTLPSNHLLCSNCLTDLLPWPLPFSPYTIVLAEFMFAPRSLSRSHSAAVNLCGNQLWLLIHACLAACQVSLPLCIVIFICPGLYRPLCTPSLTSLLLRLTVPSLISSSSSSTSSHCAPFLFLLPVPRRSGGGEA